MSVVVFHGYTIEPLYQNLPQERREEIIRMWMQHGALPNLEEAYRRVNEVACIVCNPARQVVGVSTVYPVQNDVEKAVHLHYRMFLRPQDRIPGLMREVTAVTRKFFDANKNLRGTACAMIICTENPKLMRPGARRMLENSAWKSVGKDHRGFDLWRFDFTS